ncbi:MAG: pilus assembly protein PilP [Bdellovibrionota bacterium]
MMHGRSAFWIWTLCALALPSLAYSQSKVEDFTFNPLEVKRDPFAPPEVKVSDEVDELRKYDFFEMKLVAIMTGLGAAKAMIVLPSGKTHIVQEGDRIGRNSGSVISITAKQLTVVESFKDFRGREKKSYEKLTLDK